MAARTPDGPPPPPVVQKLRLQYAKRGRLRFSSHRDFQRALERAVRRAAIPMAYSAGFHPHPKISYANAAPTGTASEAEYIEISLAERREPQAIRDSLNEALPDGLDIIDVVEAGPGLLADRLQASVWQIELFANQPGEQAAADNEAQVRDVVERFLAAERVEVQRMTKNGLRTFDAREAVLRIQVEPSVTSRPGNGCAILSLVVRHNTPAVRPDDVLSAFRAVADFAPPSPPRVTRLAQGLLDEADGSVTDPLVPDRDGGGA
ncbi:TIGR03936 family radical SAM-associated protein [Kineosporia rhizophila]|uniref:TIGR03936 family radical SAM-associated protein n=1 Tax=Kineosporia TaxID=49184 RepID=UPI001E4A53F5|nr:MULTISPECIES: TIGR03936 family radical SAM-associated protein [Kineosporia]MCE0535785.1 TIGR03936 family radical SAM-associated protein [Kineosporia rhizophila]GLY18231.1 radical SAM protein [Kineosporia sp. NBRC 101677]